MLIKYFAIDGPHGGHHAICFSLGDLVATRWFWCWIPKDHMVATRLFFFSRGDHLVATRWFQCWNMKDHMVTARWFQCWVAKDHVVASRFFFFTWKPPNVYQVVSTLDRGRLQRTMWWPVGFFFFTWKPPNVYQVVSTLDCGRPPGGHKVGFFFFVWRLHGHQVVSTLNYEGPPNGHHMCFFSPLGNHLVATKWFQPRL
jgi:hypothetical protein